MDAFCEFDGHAFAEGFAKGFSFESKTVPLVVYENGERKVIGEATLRNDPVGLDIVGRITDPTMADKVDGIGVVTRFSIGEGPPAPEDESPMTEQS